MIDLINSFINYFYLLDIRYYVIIFFIYSFAGWCMESFGGILKVKKFINRGFLIGPICPVYGFGVVLIMLCTQKYINDLFTVFIMSIFLAGCLEYFTSYIMEKLFKARWWDYRNKKFNINGRICLETLLPFGIAGTIILCFINPHIISSLEKMDLRLLSNICYFLVISSLLDFIVSVKVISGFKKIVYKEMDNTEEISKMVKEKTDEIRDNITDKLEDVAMETASNTIRLSRRAKAKRLVLERNINRNIKQKTYNISNLILQQKEKTLGVIDGFRYNKKLYEYKNREQKELFNKRLKLEYQKMIYRYNELKVNSDEFKKSIINKIINKSILHERLIKAFPNINLNMNLLNKRNKKKQRDILNQIKENEIIIENQSKK